MSYRFIPQLSDEEISRKQLEGLRFTVRQAWNAPQYREKLRACGVTPDDITSLDDLRRLPTVDVEDLREGYPLPLLCVPPRDVARIHASSGTTGKRKILAYTARDIDTFSLQIARCYELAGFSLSHNLHLAWALLPLLGFVLYAPFSAQVVLGQQYLAKNIGFASGITLGLATSLGGVVAPLLGWVADNYGMPVAFQSLAALSVVGAVFAYTLKPVATTKEEA